NRTTIPRDGASLKAQLRADLDGTITSRAGNSTHRPLVRNIGGRTAERGMIERTERVYTKFQVAAIADGRVLDQAYVPILLARPPEQVIARIPICEIRGDREGRRIEILHDRAVFRIERHSRNCVRTPSDRTLYCRRKARRERRSRHRGSETGNLPAADQL